MTQSLISRLGRKSGINGTGSAQPSDLMQALSYESIDLPTRSICKARGQNTVTGLGDVVHFATRELRIIVLPRNAHPAVSTQYAVHLRAVLLYSHVQGEHLRHATSLPPIGSRCEISYPSLTSIFAAILSAFFSAFHAKIFSLSSVSGTTSSIFSGVRLKGSVGSLNR